MSVDTLPDLDVVRTTLVSTALRADDTEAEKTSDDLGLMEVRFSPFNTWYRIESWWEGTFLERTVPGAFKRTINSHNSSKDTHSVKTLFNHGMDFSIGDKLLGDIESLSEDVDGPMSVVRLWDTSYNRDLLPGLRSGAYGSSYTFRVIKEEWDEEPEKSDHNPDGIPERTLKEVRLFEAGPVTWPASPTASAGMRCSSATDAYYEHLARRDPSRVEGMRTRLHALRSGAPADRRPDDSARSHSEGMTPAQRRLALYPYLKG